MIGLLGRFLDDAEACGVDLRHARVYFSVGEWFLAFGEVIKQGGSRAVDRFLRIGRTRFMTF